MEIDVGEYVRLAHVVETFDEGDALRDRPDDMRATRALVARGLAIRIQGVLYRTAAGQASVERFEAE